MTQHLALAQHTRPEAFWSGGEYELNLSFGMLRDRQWTRLVEALWAHEALSGPVAARYIPGEPLPVPVAVEVPEPTAAQAQYGVLQVSGLDAGCSVLATRSLFECVTVQVPVGMFDGLSTSDEAAPTQLHISPLDHVFRELALMLFEIVPFDLANIGYLAGPQLVEELQADTAQRLALINTGNFFA
ncbi:MAG: hypothetical protein K8S97_02665, partial [Anaerolineae bacterium]|nr:hypothetical protein [Anaerolineae bacterium]